MNFSNRLERKLKRARDDTETIDLNEKDPPKAIYLRNYVTTVRILKEQEETLRLRDICMAGGASCKLTPKSLPASVLRFGGNSLAGNTTALISKKGKILVVGAVGYEHARMATQEYRLFLETVPMLMRDPETQKLKVTTLESRTTFDGFGLWNVVSHTKLHMRPDLKKLCELYPQASEWDPELFPGCILRVWIKPRKQCDCQRKKKNNSCPCNCTCIVFDTGKIIVTGASNRKDTILVSECVRRFLTQSQHLHYNGAILPSHLRFQARKDYRMENFEIEFLSVMEKKRNNAGNTVTGSIQEQQQEEVNQVLDILEEIEPQPEKREELPPFIQACVNGQLEMIRSMCTWHSVEKMLLQVDSKGRNALEHLKQEFTDDQRSDIIIKSIIKILTKKNNRE